MWRHHVHTVSTVHIMSLTFAFLAVFANIYSLLKHPNQLSIVCVGSGLVVYLLYVAVIMYLPVMYIELCGCLAHYILRLVGFPPFWHRKQLVMLRSIMDGNYEFVSPEWDDISDQAKDLVGFIIIMTLQLDMPCHRVHMHFELANGRHYYPPSPPHP